MGLSTPVITDARVLPGREYVLGISGKPGIGMSARIDVEWRTAANAVISTTTAGAGVLAVNEWNRSVLTARHLAPAAAAKFKMSMVIPGPVSAGSLVDWDAALFRLVSTIGG